MGIILQILKKICIPSKLLQVNFPQIEENLKIEKNI